MDECGSSHDVQKHALNLHSSKEIDLPPTAVPLDRRTARTYRSRRHVVAPNVYEHVAVFFKQVECNAGARHRRRARSARSQRNKRSRFQIWNLDAARAAGGVGGRRRVGQWERCARKP